MTTATMTAAQQADPKTGELPGAATSEFERLLQQSFSPREMLDGNYLDRIYRIAESLANSKLSVPEHLRGNVGDCMAIVTQAMLWNMNPFAVAQKTHIVSGRLGYEAQLVNAVLQNSGAVRGLPHYDYKGEGNALECRVGFVPRGGTQPVWNEFLKISDVTTKNSPLWKTNPKQQLGYLQVKNWARAYCPGAILGVYTTDELADGEEQVTPTTTAVPRNAPAAVVGAAAAASKPDRTPAHDKIVEQLELEAFNNGFEAFKAAWGKLPKEDRAAIGLGERDRIGAIGQETDRKMAEVAAADAAAAAGGAGEGATS